MHLVNWEKVKNIVLEGGLQIKDSGLSNLALGGKLLWQLFSNKKHPVSQILWKKYLHGGTLRNLQLENTPKGSIIWNLCRSCLEFFRKHLYQILGNVRQTYLWEDKIAGNTPLNFDASYSEFQIWLVNKGILKLFDIISWECNGNWDAWSFPKVLDRDPLLLA